jgi:putative zinc finger/helix-turn-helix YgiT family protein
MTRDCLACGASMDRHVEPHRYGRGIGVVIDDAVVWRCPSCGEVEVEIQNIEGLHAAIATALAQKPARLTAGEIRWLRTHLGYSSVDFAELMGVSAETVSRWERVDAPTAMQLPSERLLRFMTIVGKPAPEYRFAEMGHSTEPARPLHITRGSAGWISASAG